MNEAFVYALLDPLKPGRFVYEGLPCSFLLEPIYIGKGRKRRHRAHLNRIVNKKLNKRIQQIRSNNSEILPIKIITDLDDFEALKLEENFIKIIGRACIKTGPLCNISTGGESPTGFIQSPEVREKIKLNNAHYWKGKTKSKETRDKISKTKKLLYSLGLKHPQKGKKATSNQLRGLSQKGRRWTPELKEKLKNRKPWNAVMWLLISPQGDTFEVNGLTNFCKQYGLNQSHLWKVAKGRRIQHKGWRCFKLSDSPTSTL